MSVGCRLSAPSHLAGSDVSLVIVCGVILSINARTLKVERGLNACLVVSLGISGTGPSAQGSLSLEEAYFRIIHHFLALRDVEGALTVVSTVPQRHSLIAPYIRPLLSRISCQLISTQTVRYTLKLRSISLGACGMAKPHGSTRIEHGTLVLQHVLHGLAHRELTPTGNLEKWPSVGTCTGDVDTGVVVVA